MVAEGDDGAKVALITGGSRGIGAEIARSLIETGFEVAITGRNADRLFRPGMNGLDGPVE